MASFNKRSLDTIDFNSDIEHIDSPRSKKALMQMGLDGHKLFFLSLQDYINQHPKLRSASSEIQQKRYNNFEIKRKERLNRAKEIRNEIIKAEENNLIEFKNTQSYFYLTDSFLKKEMDRLDQMKKHQISEVKSIIDHELQMTTLRKKTDEKLKQYHEQEEQAQEQKLREQLEKMLKQRQEEKEREEKMKKEDLKQYYKAKQKEEEEKEKKDEENKRKEQLELELYKKQQEQQKHHEEIRRKFELLLMKDKYEQAQKQKENEQKEENRKRLFEERRRENSMKNQKMNSVSKEKIYQNNHRNQQELNKKRITFEKKQQIRKNQMKQYSEELQRRNQEHNHRVRKKERKIIEFTQMNYLLSLKKIEDYDNKSDYINQIRQKNKEKKRSELLIKIEKAKLLGKDNSERKMKVDASLNLKNIMLLEKYNQSDEKVKLQKEIGYKATLDKLIDHEIQFEENNETYALNNKQLEFYKKLKKEEMSEKSKRVEEYQNQKMRIIEKSKQCQEKMKLRKEEMLNKIHRLLQKGKVYTPEEMYKKIFTQEEYKALIPRTPSHYYQSALISPNHSRYGFSPKLNMDNNDSNKTYNKWYTIKENGSKENNSKVMQKKENEEGLFMTQERYKSLDKIIHP